MTLRIPWFQKKKLNIMAEMLIEMRANNAALKRIEVLLMAKKKKK